MNAARFWRGKNQFAGRSKMTRKRGLQIGARLNTHFWA